MLERIYAMNTKRIVSSILAAGLAMSISAAAYAAEIPIERLGSSISISENTADIVKSKSVKNTLVVEQGESVYIPSGVKLTLKAGAVINGSLVIEDGGTLMVKGGTLKINGDLICLGKLYIGKNAKLQQSAESLFFAGKGSSVTIKGTAGRSEISRTVCLGKFSGTEKSEQFLGAYCPDAMAAVSYSCDPFAGTLLSSAAVTDIAIPTEVFTNFDEIPNGDSGSYLSVLYSNGSAVCFSIAFDGTLFAIDGVSVAAE